MNVIDMIAPTLPALLDKIDGRRPCRSTSSCTPPARTIDDTSPGFFDAASSRP